MIQFTLHQIQNSFCVYEQWINRDDFYKNDRERADFTGKPFFIGYSRCADVFKMTDAYRNSQWLKAITDETSITTIIIYISDDLTTIRNATHHMSRERKAYCNARGFQYSGKGMVTCRQGIHEGKEYESAGAAARHNGIAAPTMANHLNGKPGYAVIKGMRFTRGTPRMDPTDYNPPARENIKTSPIVQRMLQDDQPLPPLAEASTKVWTPPPYGSEPLLKDQVKVKKDWNMNEYYDHDLCEWLPIPKEDKQ